MGAGDIDFAKVNRDDENLLFIDAGFGKDLPGGAGNEALTPKFQAVTADWLFEADAIGDGDIAAVRHRVAALNQFPRAVLVGSILGFFFRVPADGGRVE